MKYRIEVKNAKGEWVARKGLPVLDDKMEAYRLVNKVFGSRWSAELMNDRCTIRVAEMAEASG